MKSEVELPALSEEADKLIQFYKQCLSDTAPIAPMELIQDSQTWKLLDAIFEGRQSPAILDYGCGRLRLLNALILQRSELDWIYHGVDIDDPTKMYVTEVEQLKCHEAVKDRWSVGSIHSLRSGSKRFDIVTVVNVFHELPILDMAKMIEDARQHLKPDGILLVMDTVLLPEGEPRFVPVLSGQIGEILGAAARDLSYTSKRQIPISFFAVEQRHIPLYHNLAPQIRLLHKHNRDMWSLMSVRIEHAKLTKMKSEMGLISNGLFSYGYLNSVTANANFRLIEYDSTAVPAPKQVSEFAVLFFQWFDKVFEDTSQCPKIIDVYNAFGSTIDYDVIACLLNKLRVDMLVAPFAIMDRIKPMELWDILLDSVGLEMIENEGLEAAIAEASILLADTFN